MHYFFYPFLMSFKHDLKKKYIENAIKSTKTKNLTIKQQTVYFKKSCV